MSTHCLGSSSKDEGGIAAGATARSGCPLHGVGSVAGGVGVFTYGLVSYVAFVGAFVYSIGFVDNLVVPKSIDSGDPGPIVPSLLINAVLLAAFVVQHTIMARPWFKRWWTRIVPATAERSTYVLLASILLVLVMWQWRPLPGVVWEVTNPAVRAALFAVSVAGFGLALAASCMVSHFDLFGLRQVWLRLTRQEYRPVGFRLAGLYKLVRHPLMLGFLIAFWVTPVMTVGHLFFAVMTTAYIRFGTWMEERDLVAEHGESYRAYRRRVRGLLPLPIREQRAEAAVAYPEGGHA